MGWLEKINDYSKEESTILPAIHFKSPTIQSKKQNSNSGNYRKNLSINKYQSKLEDINSNNDLKEFDLNGIHFEVNMGDNSSDSEPIMKNYSSNMNLLFYDFNSNDKSSKRPQKIRNMTSMNFYKQNPIKKIDGKSINRFKIGRASCRERVSSPV